MTKQPADIILGKGEVGSSILPSSTILHFGSPKRSTCTLSHRLSASNPRFLGADAPKTNEMAQMLPYSKRMIIECENVLVRVESPKQVFGLSRVTVRNDEGRSHSDQVTGNDHDL